MSHYQELATVVRLTGFHIRCGLLEEVGAVHIEDDRILVQINRVRAASQKMGLKVTHRGATLHEFTRDGTSWVRKAEPITVWWSTDEYHTSVRTPAAEEIAAKRDWEDLCHRPGTGQTPLDNADRQRQGY
jgi:hypothetical protein